MCALNRKRPVQMKSTEKRYSYNTESSFCCCSLISPAGLVNSLGILERSLVILQSLPLYKGFIPRSY